MADELTLNTGWTYNKNGRKRVISPTVSQEDISGAGVVENMQAIGFAAHEALVLGDVATPGFCYFRNSHATNYIEIGIDSTGTFVPFIKLMAGQSCFVWWGGTDPYAKANTSAINLDYAIADR